VDLVDGGWGMGDWIVGSTLFYFIPSFPSFVEGMEEFQYSMTNPKMQG
jgi:hypothetical protein